MGRLCHPITGVILHDNVDCWQEALNEADERKGQLLKYVHDIDEMSALIRLELADARGPAQLPAPTHRSVKQDRVAACPRCGGRQMAWEDL
jgi:hypothetical protein